MSSKKKLLSLFLCIIAVTLVAALIARDGYLSDYEAQERNTVSMGTVLSLRLYGSNEPPLMAELIKEVERLEKTISVKLEDTAAWRLNRDGSVTNGDIAQLSSLCSDVCNSSRGAFDVTTGSLTRLWDIGGDHARVPKKSELEAALKRVDGSMVRLNEAENRVTIGKGQYVDFGAVGKGYACDKVLKLLKASQIKGAAVSVGGSVLLYGKHNPKGDPWQVAVRDPRGSETDYIGTMLIESGCVSTSGDYERTLTVDGKTYHHILDPKTGYPAKSELSSVTVVTEEGKGALCDALSTACFVLGCEKGKQLLEGFGARGIFVSRSGELSIVGELDFEAS